MLRKPAEIHLKGKQLSISKLIFLLLFDTLKAKVILIDFENLNSVMQIILNELKRRRIEESPEEFNNTKI